MDAVLLDTDVFSYLMKPKDARGDALVAVLVGWRYHVLPDAKRSEMWVQVTQQEVCVLIGTRQNQRIRCE